MLPQPQARADLTPAPALLSPDVIDVPLYWQALAPRTLPG